MNKKTGFTLIELLVVIAIIGILSGIVLISVNSIRQSAKVSAIKGNLEQARLAAEVHHNTNGDYSTFCAGADEGRINAAVIDTAVGGTNYLCADAASEFCVEVTMPGSAGDWCVDSAGYSGATASCVDTDTNRHCQ